MTIDISPPRSNLNSGTNPGPLFFFQWLVNLTAEKPGANNSQKLF